MHNWFVYHQSLWIICLWITAGNCAWNLMVGMLVCVLSVLEVLTSYSSYTYFLSMHAFTSEGAAGKCIWSACIISKLVLINSRENVVHGPGKIETISLTALASRETQWTSEFVIPRGHAYSYFIFICKAKASYSTWAIALEHHLGKSLRIAACYIRPDSSPEWLLSVSISLSGWSLCRMGLCPFLRESSSVLGGMSLLSFSAGCCSWRPILVQLIQKVHRLQTLLFPFILLLQS